MEWGAQRCGTRETVALRALALAANVQLNVLWVWKHWLLVSRDDIIVQVRQAVFHAPLLLLVVVMMVVLVVVVVVVVVVECNKCARCACSGECGKSNNNSRRSKERRHGWVWCERVSVLTPL